MDIVQNVEKYGFSWVLAVLFILICVYVLKDIMPKLQKIESTITGTLNYDEELEKIISNSNRALEEVAKSSDNVAKSLQILNVTLTGQMEIMKMLYQDTKETQARLYAHDDRSEKIYTMVRALEIGSGLSKKEKEEERE